ncbi:Fe-Mn family superoxide dismutase [Nonomuraea insulae]|uniref:Fe-Mn family superoxide dismutase n=1 Tax=Nonomuraea insulae TaxID=1616787 RepID=A0ABW1CXC1_9ACTN
MPTRRFGTFQIREGLRPAREPLSRGLRLRGALYAWELAYYLRYRNVRPDYVEKLWALINWEDVAWRFADVTSQAG